MAIQAFGSHRPVKVLILGLVTRRQVPLFSLGVPANRRLKEVTLVVDEIRPSPGSGAERELDLGFRFGDDIACRIVANFTVKHTLPTALDLILETLPLEGVMRRRVVTLQRSRLRDWRQGATHGMLSIGGGHGGVAASA